LLDQAVYHIEHLRLGIADIPAGAAVAATATG
jgi:ABC-type amino acid transport system permease subunit